MEGTKAVHVRYNKITENEREILGLIAQGYCTGAQLARQAGRGPEGCAQTAASLLRKRLVTKDRVKGIVHYRITDAGKAWLCQACLPGSNAIRHTCGLARLQDMLRIG